VTIDCIQDLKSVFHLDAGMELFSLICGEFEGNVWYQPIHRLELTAEDKQRILEVIRALEAREPYKHFLS
jgi:hypothetical protein